MARICVIITSALFLFFPAERLSSEEDPYAVCLERCSSMTGQGKYQCVQTCVRTMKKNRAPGSGKVSKHMEECERLCSSFEGVENLRCMRICLDKYRGATDSDDSVEPMKKNPDDAVCEKRCGMLDPSMKYDCLKKCKESMKRNRGVNVW